MKIWVAILLLLGIPGAGLKTISRINDFSDRAARAYQRENYAEAITAYEYLLNDLEVEDDQITLNLAHAYFKAGLMQEAQEQYYLLADHPSDYIRSVVHLQLGNIASNVKKYAQALSLYRNALIANPANEEARFNYELLKKYLLLHPEKAEQPKQEPEAQQGEQPDEQLPPPADEAQEAPQPKQNPDPDGNREEETEQPQSDPAGQQQGPGSKSNTPRQKQKEAQTGSQDGDTEGRKFEENTDPAQSNQRGSTDNAAANDSRAQTRAVRQQVKISAEKARMLLNAMRDAELQYLQQLPKKAKTKKDSNTPDW